MRRKDHATQADIDEHADTRMNIIDEISFADYDLVLGKVSANLQAFTECREFHRESTQSAFWVTFAN